MEQREIISDFFQSGAIAVVGASGNKNKFGNTVFKELKQKGFNVFAVNPNRKEIEGEKCFSSLTAIPQQIENAVFVIPPEQTNETIKDALPAGIKRLWLQQGSESSEAVSFCEKNGIEVVHNKCILMYAPPVKSLHKFHRVIWNVIGRL